MFSYLIFQVLDELKKIIPAQADVEEVVVDFEVAMWNGITHAFPEVEIHRCMFHFCQAVYRKVASLGLTTAYKENGSVHTIVKQLLVLPYLPRRHIAPTFEEMRGQVQNSAEV